VFAPPVAKAPEPVAGRPAAARQRRSRPESAGDRAGSPPGLSWDFTAIPVTSPASGQDAAGSPPALSAALREAGHPADPATLARFEPAFGCDLSAVRLHTSDRAAASAATVAARAYTVGNHIVFGRGEYAPGTGGGRRLIAHELAHVIQQSRGGSATPAEAPALQASADHAAEAAASGRPARVAGRARPGIARQPLFDEFSAGHYSWPILRLAVFEGDRPAATIVADLGALTLAEREQAMRDLARERASQAVRLTDLQEKQGAQADPATQALFDPVIGHIVKVTDKADQVLDGVSAGIAGTDTAASLRAGTTAPAAAQKPLIETAIKPELRTTPAGAPAPFEENLAGDPESYLAKLRVATPLLIDGHYHDQVDNRGPAEHGDQAKVHPLTEFQRIGNASKRETDAVFGQFKTGPAMKADTAAARGNIHDLFADTRQQLAAMSAGQRREMARQLIFYFFQSDGPIADINRKHNADPRFTPPLNQEATDQTLVTMELTDTPEKVRRLNEIDRQRRLGKRADLPEAGRDLGPARGSRRGRPGLPVGHVPDAHPRVPAHARPPGVQRVREQLRRELQPGQHPDRGCGLAAGRGRVELRRPARERSGPARRCGGAGVRGAAADHRAARLAAAL
jgi:hypothetical protein